jgi:hypothetical protein
MTNRIGQTRSHAQMSVYMTCQGEANCVTHSGMPLTANSPVVLFGAFDRHNFGDMLFPHVASNLLKTEAVLFAGLVERDLRPYGGHEVQALNEVVAGAGQALKLIHVGGELLGCDAWEAAVMVSQQPEAEAAVRQLDHRPVKRAAWAAQKLATGDIAPYVVLRTVLPPRSQVYFHAVGGADLDAREEAFRDEVLAKLNVAGSITVRDTKTQSILANLGLSVELVPDPAVMVSRLFDGKIRMSALNGETGALCRRYPQGYVAVQCSADHDDDASIGMIAAQLDLICSRTRLGCVFFRAGAAPWHDSLQCYRRITQRMKVAASHIFESLDLWEICALISCSRLTCASSLHARIVAMAFGLPRLTFKDTASAFTKHKAYLSTWELPALQEVVSLDRIADAAALALGCDPHLLSGHAEKLAAMHERAFLQQFK